ncbi:MAG TPA: hypothetical protein P5234_07755 [Thermoanaerobaculaceae bacterium]|mgnify:CR=1 FL=1|nr:hypothetical protein [Thermoanaerobaculaceae bacterium]HRS16133.1 hypothetical protein [Thermoanaerobaculaceae bacterium]
MHTLVKVCGVTTPSDAALAAAAGADLVGFVLDPRARRGVTVEEAAGIAAAARDGGAEPVAVCVAAGAAEIAELAARLHLSMVELHGAPARAAAGELPAGLGRIVAVEPGLAALPPGFRPARDLVLLDGPTGGAGVRLDWARLRPPAGVRWLLAGGLDADNVAEALRMRPHGVDVSSGVCGSDPRRKDPERVHAFVWQVRRFDAEHA